MTEEEAKTKWCPFARQMVTIDDAGGNAQNIASANRFNRDKVALCIGSACMAWRWSRVIHGHGQPTPMPPGKPDGYCGLAGKP